MSNLNNFVSRKNSVIEKGKKTPKILILGNPNSGKSALFNQLTGMHQKISNFPGVTVEKKSGWLRHERILVEDYPGTYSMQAQSPDEKIVSDQIHSWRNKENRPDLVVVVIDSTNLSRNIFFALQVIERGLPTVVVLNMYDQVKRKKITIDCAKLQRMLGVEDVIPTSAKSGEGINEIVAAIKRIISQTESRPEQYYFLLKSDERLLPLKPLIDYLIPLAHQGRILPLIDSIQLVGNDEHLDQMRPFLSPEDIEKTKKLINSVRETCRIRGIDCRTLESALRYAYIDDELRPAFQDTSLSEKTSSEIIDRFITHPVLGSVFFILILGFIFNIIFSWATYPMELIEGGIGGLAQFTRTMLPPSHIRSLLIEGVIGGVGNIIVFLPQIVLLVFFIGILEDSGYMARMSFMLDGMMGKFGLSGKAVLPLLSGFACAIPAVMAARTIENHRDRLLIILLIPLMSCSARLPVYTLLISTMIPGYMIGGFLNLQGLVLLGMYFLGLLTAMFIAMLVKKISGKNRLQHYWIEMPPYRIPMLRSLWWRVYDAGKKFLLNAGSIILAMTIVLWFLASYPKADRDDDLAAREQVAQSYAGQLGHRLEPFIAPLGFDWKIGIGLISSFAAREVIISTFSTIYNIEAGDEKESVSLRHALRNDKYPDGRQVFTPLVALSLLVFFVYAAQCMSTFAIIRRETASWRWPVFMIVYMNALAYMAALIVYQGGNWLFGG